MGNNNDVIDVIDEILVSDESSAKNLNLAFAQANKNISLPKHRPRLFATWFDTKLGTMLAIADECALLMLEFFDRRSLLDAVVRLRTRTKTIIVPGMTSPLRQLEKELDQYFSGKLKEFSVPVNLFGTEFQLAAWKALKTIPYGETRSYQQQATIIGHPKAHRAVANANGCNRLAVILPCHRIINSDGRLGGYGGRLDRKQWLLSLERGH